MNASVLVYTSATGFTARYAQLLSRKTGLPCLALERAKELPAGTEVVYLGWLCAGGIKGLKKARNRLQVKAVCAVGMAPASPEVVNKLAGQNHLEGLPFFYLRGGYAPEKLPGPYKLMMAPMTKAVTGHPPKDENEAAMQEAFRHGGDWVDEGALAPVLAWLEGS